MSYSFSAGGKQVLLNYVQESPAEHVSLEEVLRALGIEGAPPAGDESAAEGATAAAGAGKPGVVCDEDVCQIKK